MCDLVERLRAALAFDASNGTDRQWSDLLAEATNALEEFERQAAFRQRTDGLPPAEWIDAARATAEKTFEALGVRDAMCASTDIKEG